MEKSLVCQVCGNSEKNQVYVVKEMMYGYRDEFEYFECVQCGCLQIQKIPNNLEKYYPKQYYSYEIPSGLKEYLKHTIASNQLYHRKNLIGLILGKKFYSVAGAWVDWFH